MNKSIMSKIRMLIVLAMVGAFVWVFILSPMLTFKANEKKLEDAAKRYYELFPNSLPTGERVGTVTLETLYSKSFIDKDIFIPLTKKTCSVSNSWVKVKKENGEYKYYTYLECGVMSSTIDHKGPEIKLNGDTEITLGIGEEFKDPGVKSVIDNKDGKIDVKNVKIKGDKIDTSKVGTYEIKYVALDNLNNRTEVVRTVEVVQKLNSLIKTKLTDKDYFVGENPNNYIYFSNMVFRIIGLDGKNVRIVADKDIANVNYDGINDWFKYYESNLTDNAKKHIKKSKFCNMKITKDNYNTTECSSYGNKTKFGLLSVDEINRATVDGKNYFINRTFTWTANSSGSKKATVFGKHFNFNGVISNYNNYEKNLNFGVRPVFEIDGNMLVSAGDGSEKKPYVLEDYIAPIAHVNVNERYVGEYINYSGHLWRISKIESDGTVRIICEDTMMKDGKVYEIDYNTGSSKKIYNPKQKGNPGYIINNRTSEFLNTKYAVLHEIEVPIYKKMPNYGKEVETKKYTVKVSAPNMYEMFGAASDSFDSRSYWLINSSKDVNIKSSVSDIGVVMFEKGAITYEFGIRPVIYLNKDCLVSSGKGTKFNPFIITK